MAIAKHRHQGRRRVTSPETLSGMPQLETFPLAEARAAHERAAEGHIRGKIVLVVP